MANLVTFLFMYVLPTLVTVTALVAFFVFRNEKQPLPNKHNGGVYVGSKQKDMQNDL